MTFIINIHVGSKSEVPLYKNTPFKEYSTAVPDTVNCGVIEAQRSKDSGYARPERHYIVGSELHIL
jgi:hypothetical protein